MATDFGFTHVHAEFTGVSATQAARDFIESVVLARIFPEAEAPGVYEITEFHDCENRPLHVQGFFVGADNAYVVFREVPEADMQRVRYIVLTNRKSFWKVRGIIEGPFEPDDNRAKEAISQLCAESPW